MYKLTYTSARIIHECFENFHTEDKFDLIVSNPPYVSSNISETLQPEVAQFEPSEALYGGPVGHETLERWLPKISISFPVPLGVCGEKTMVSLIKIGLVQSAFSFNIFLSSREKIKPCESDLCFSPMTRVPSF